MIIAQDQAQHAQMLISPQELNQNSAHEAEQSEQTELAHKVVNRDFIREVNQAPGSDQAKTISLPAIDQNRGKSGKFETPEDTLKNPSDRSFQEQ